jgi:hypothetical protein
MRMHRQVGRDGELDATHDAVDCEHDGETDQNRRPGVGALAEDAAARARYHRAGQYNLSRLLDRMESVGYLERRTCLDDRRGHVIHITQAGKVIRRKMWPEYARAIEHSLGRHLSAKQAHALDDALGRVVERQSIR